MMNRYLFQRSFHGELVFDHSFKNNLDLLTRIYGDHADEDYYWELFPEGFPGYPDGMIGSPRLKFDTYGGELKVDYETFKTNVITLGALYEKIKLYDVASYSNFHPITFAPATRRISGHIRLG